MASLSIREAANKFSSKMSPAIIMYYHLTDNCANIRHGQMPDQSATRQLTRHVGKITLP